MTTAPRTPVPLPASAVAIGSRPSMVPEIPSGLVAGSPCPTCHRRPKVSGTHATVLDLAGQGLDPDLIDRAYRWAWDTAALYTRVAARCLRANNTAHAVDIAVRAGLIAAPEFPDDDRPAVTDVLRTTGQLLADGHTQARIAEIRGVHSRTVATSVRRLYDELDVTSAAAVVLTLHSLGLLATAHPCPCQPVGALTSGILPHLATLPRTRRPTCSRPVPL
ncbi:helix-turn-helix transcriptional regulator [Kitasatospora sp. NPDC098663]|uniref:helix-turn-helix transcriptional regulator n=1 Tax=Kitasatospora sp. NPDC098663 TaxID=3364096 RepID=UPI00382F1E86